MAATACVQLNSRAPHHKALKRKKKKQLKKPNHGHCLLCLRFYYFYGSSLCTQCLNVLEPMENKCEYEWWPHFHKNKIFVQLKTLFYFIYSPIGEKSKSFFCVFLLLSVFARYLIKSYNFHHQVLSLHGQFIWSVDSFLWSELTTG